PGAGHARDHPLPTPAGAGAAGPRARAPGRSHSAVRRPHAGPRAGGRGLRAGSRGRGGRGMTGAALLDRLAPAEAADTAGPGALAARAWLAAHGLPDPKDEAWRYTPVDQIVARLHEVVGAAVLDGGRGDDVDLATVDALAGDHGGPRLVFVDGLYRP